MANVAGDRWEAGDAYDAFMGRWSRQVARVFLEWLQPPRSANWLEVGCGTGALTATICDLCEPESVVACEPSAPFVEYARANLPDARVSFVAAGAEGLPRRTGGFDAAVAGLVLNFLQDPDAALVSIRERLRRPGLAAAYVWDYADGMEFLRFFWEEAAALDPRAATLHEAKRFPLCQAPALVSLFRTAGFERVECDALDIHTEFATFDDYWAPFLRGTGPAPSYVASLDSPGRESLRAQLEKRVSKPGTGVIRLRARAWAVRGGLG